jgi:uncharacterized damage-inducible protein DinB
MFRRALIAIGLLLQLSLPATLAAQSPSSHTADGGVMFSFQNFADIFGGRLIAAFDSIPAAKYDYRPTAPQQTVGYIAQHLEDANYSLCERFGDLKHKSTAKDSLADTVKARWPKDTLVARLEASLGFCDSALARVPSVDTPGRASLLLAFETDLAEHYSQISSYMRLLGMVPPSALPPRQRTAIDVAASTLSQYVGVYQLAPGVQFDVTQGNGGLSIKSNIGSQAVRLWPETKNDFFVKEADAQITFTHDAVGAVTGLVRHQFGRDRFAPRVR